MTNFYPNHGHDLRNAPPALCLNPLPGFDVWEHAYYLDYQNRHPELLANLWKIIDWQVVEKTDAMTRTRTLFIAYI